MSTLTDFERVGVQMPLSTIVDFGSGERSPLARLVLQLRNPVKNERREELFLELDRCANGGAWRARLWAGEFYGVRRLAVDDGRRESLGEALDAFSMYLGKPVQIVEMTGFEVQ